MSLHDIATVVAPSRLLTESQLLALYQYLATARTPSPVYAYPAGNAQVEILTWN